MSKPKTTARLIVTYRCNRSCLGCCNNHDNRVREITDINELIEYDEIVITGGEPMVIPEEISKFIINVAGAGYRGSIFLYTAYLRINSDLHKDIVDMVDGITYTLHAESLDGDIKNLKRLSSYRRLADSDFSSRLIIDSRLYDRYDFSNIDLTNWDVIRKLQWKDKCEPAEHEELLYFPLDGR